MKINLILKQTTTGVEELKSSLKRDYRRGESATLIKRTPKLVGLLMKQALN